MFVTSLRCVAKDVSLALTSWHKRMILMPQMFDVIANENTRNKCNEFESIFYAMSLIWFCSRPFCFVFSDQLDILPQVLGVAEEFHWINLFFLFSRQQIGRLNNHRTLDFPTHSTGVIFRGHILFHEVGIAFFTLGIETTLFLWLFSPNQPTQRKL